MIKSSAKSPHPSSKSKLGKKWRLIDQFNLILKFCLPVRSPVMRTREGLIMERAGPTRRLKSSALSGWWTLKWRSDSWTAHTTERGPPSTSMTVLARGRALALVLPDSSESTEIAEESSSSRPITTRDNEEFVAHSRFTIFGWNFWNIFSQRLASNIYMT